MTDLLRFIPGFRSNAKWKKIVASTYYALSLLFIINNVFMALCYISIPFVIFSLLNLLTAKKKGVSVKNATIYFVAAFLVFSLTLALSGTSIDSIGDKVIVEKPNNSENVEQNEDIEIISDDYKDVERTSAPALEDGTSSTEELDGSNGEGIDVVGGADKGDDSEKNLKSIQNGDSNVSGKIVVHYIDVGQGDSIFIQTPLSNILIDGGERGDIATNYLKSQGVKELDLVIGTHPHADHIGGLVNVLESIKVKEVIDPAVVHTSKTFEDYLTLIDVNDIKFTEAKDGMKRDLGGGVKLEILGPLSVSDSNLNNVSVVARLTYGNTSFLFTGDAETVVLNQLAKGNIRSDVLKVSHHGSRNGITQSFISAVSPKAAVISAGKDNSYGHPHEEALRMLSDAGVNIYRTDLHGTIVIESNGQVIDVNIKKPYQYVPAKVPEHTANSITTPSADNTLSEKETTLPADSVTNGKYIGSLESDKYHKPDCRYAKKILPENELWFNTIEEAARAGYKPCGVCKPK